jgi:hypothetical protein
MKSSDAQKTGRCPGEPGNINDLAFTIFPVQAIAPSSRTDLRQVTLPSQMRRSPFCGDDRLRTFPTIPRTSARASVRFTRGRTRVTFVPALGTLENLLAPQWCPCCAVYATRMEARRRLVREQARRAMREPRIMPAGMCDIRRISKWILRR